MKDRSRDAYLQLVLYRTLTLQICTCSQPRCDDQSGLPRSEIGQRPHYLSAAAAAVGNIL